MKISVIIPVYNMEKYLPECLDSVIGQTLKEIEIIAVNDGSTDNSLAILEEYSGKYADIVVLTQRNQGAGPARNNGIKRAIGKYLSFMDPDDYYPDSDCLEALYSAAEKYNVSMCGGIVVQNLNGRRIVHGGENVRSFYTDRKVKACDYTDIYWFQRYLFRSDLIKGNGILFPPYRCFEDPPFLVEALACAGEFYGLDKEVYVHRVGCQKTYDSAQICADILCGVRDVFLLSHKHDLKYLYEKRLRDIHEDYMIPFYKHSFCGNDEIDRTIREIGDIVENWAGDGGGWGLTREKVIQVRKDCQKEYRMFLEMLWGGRKKIIYGAGVMAHRLMAHYGDKADNIIGIATTENPIYADTRIEGLPVDRIDRYLQYREEALVLIAVSSIYQEEIEHHLRDLGFRYVFRVNMKKIEMAETFRECMGQEEGF